MNYEKPNLKKEEAAETELRDMVNAWGIDLYEDVPEGWKVMDEFVALYDLSPKDDEDDNLVKRFDDLYGKGFWGVKVTKSLEGDRQYHLVDIIARIDSDDALPAEDEFTQMVDSSIELKDDLTTAMDAEKAAQPTIPEKDIIKRVPITKADGTTSEIIVIRGRGMSDQAVGKVVDLVVLEGGLIGEVKDYA